MYITVALSISFFIPLGYLYIIRSLDFFGTGKFIYNLATVLWGIIAYLLAASINSSLLNNNLITYGQLLRLVAPITEEILKSVILLHLVRRKDFNYVVDGAIYGFGTGIGFAMVENYEYIIRNPEEAIFVAIARVFSTNLIHATTSGLIGSALAAGRIEPGWRWILTGAGGFILATGIHTGFNTMLGENALPASAIIVGVLGAILIIVIIKWGLKLQQTWIVETFGMTNQITRSEAVAAQRIQSLDDILAPVTLQFGPDKASQTRSLLFMLAEIGIKRKILEKTYDVELRPRIEWEIQRITSEMERVRRGIGPYCMLFVRTVYLENGNRVWELINQRVAATGTGQAGGGLWSRLDDRLKESKSRKTDHE
jgi:RsiW-degrading membrane proteinase PrsW (M82 family)